MRDIMKLVNYLKSCVQSLLSRLESTKVEEVTLPKVEEVVQTEVPGNVAQEVKVEEVKMADVFGVNVKVEFLRNGVVESTGGGEYPTCGYKNATIIQRAVAESLLALGDAKAAQLEAQSAVS